MRRILLTGIGGDVACAVIRCIMENGGDTELYGIDIKKYTPYMKIFKRTDTAPGYAEEEKWIQYIQDYILKYGITHFLPITEPEILIADKHRNFFEANNIKLVINNRSILEICTSKYKTACFLRENQVDVPETYRAENYAGELEFPFIVKADYGRGSASLQIVKDSSQWKHIEKRNMVCQELIGDRDHEFTVGVFSNGKDVESIIYRRQLGYGGMSVAVECVAVPEIRAISERIAGLLKLEGSINIQMREWNGKYYIFEINPRLSSTAGFRHKMGFTDTIWWLDLTDGKQQKIIFEIPAGAVGIKMTDDIVYKSEKNKRGVVDRIETQTVPMHRTCSDFDRGGYWNKRIRFHIPDAAMYQAVA